MGSPPLVASARTWKAASWLAPPLAALAVFAVTLGHGFIADDDLLIQSNEQISRGGTWRELLLSDWFGRTGGGAIGYYRPVAKASLRLTYLLAGPRPAAFHLGNLVLHMLTALALAALARRFMTPLAATFAGVLFAVHPSTAQAVSIITARPDVLAGLWVITAALAFSIWRDGRRPLWLGLALAASALAFGSKESAVLLPLALLLQARAKGERVRKALVATLPFGVLAGTFLVLRSWVVGIPQANTLARLDGLERAGAVLKALGAYVGPLVTGQPIVALPHLPADPFDLVVLLGFFCALAAAGVLWATRLRSPLSFSLSLGALSLGPALAVWLIRIPMWPDAIPIAERWLYLPVAAMALTAGLLLDRLRPSLVLGLAGPLAALLALLGVQRALCYRSTAAYSEHAVVEFQRVGEQNLFPNERYLLHYHRGLAASAQGNLPEAGEALEQAAALGPWLGEAWEALAILESRRGRHRAAEAAARRLLSEEFWRADEGRRQRLLFQSDAEVRIDRAALHAVVGRSLGTRGEWTQALAEFDLAKVGARDDDRAGQYQLDRGFALEALGRLAEARDAYEEAQRLDPSFFGAPLRLAALDLKQGHRQEAQQRLRQVIARGGEGAARARKMLGD